MFSPGHSCREHSVHGPGSSTLRLQLRVERDAVQSSGIESTFEGPETREPVSQVPCRVFGPVQNIQMSANQMLCRTFGPVQNSIRYLVYAKGALKFGPVQNIREHIWSMPNGFGQDQISRTFRSGPNVSMDILDRTKYDQISEDLLEWTKHLLDIFGQDQMVL